jgi:hypothetical protein
MASATFTTTSYHTATPSKSYSFYIFKPGQPFYPSGALIVERGYLKEGVMGLFKKHGLDCGKDDLKFIEKLEPGEYLLIDRDFCYDYYIERNA